jgi:hypothetical protein
LFRSGKTEDLIRERGPLTVAAFMDFALYDPDAGYYARAAQRSGRAGDFFTSVDVGPVFGDLLEIQIAEMAAILTTTTAEHAENSRISARPRALRSTSSIWSKPAPGTAGYPPTSSAPPAGAIPTSTTGRGSISPRPARARATPSAPRSARSPIA